MAAAKKITYGYDQRYWLKTTTYGDASPSISRTYHGDGLPATISSNGTVWTYTYNKRRLLTKESLAYASKTYDITHGYDANGAPSQLTYPGGSGTSIAYSPNGLGQPTQVGSYAVGVHHHPNGAVAYFDYGNGVARTMTQNKRGLPDEVRDVGVLWDDYSYDANGNVAGITDKQESVSTRSMTYDYLDRLATVNAPAMWGNAVIGTDLLDNVSAVTIPSGPTARTTAINYDAATNRISSITGSAPAVSFAYDSQGNITTRGTAGYVFDQGNRLTSATGKASYVYDGLGRRVKTAKTDGTNLIHVYSQAGELLYSSTAVGAATPAETLYVNLNGHLLAEVGGAYVHTDGLGSPIARTNAARTVISRTRYEPYGLTASGTTPTVGYTGHVNDADTGLVYMQQRYYDPVAARFLSIDPVTTDADTGGSFNRYAYAANSPYKYVDPDGRAIETAIDVFSLGLSIAAYKSEPSLMNGLGLAYDAVATAVPFLPAGAGIIRAGGRTADALAPTKRGVESEARVLNDIGEVKNTKTVGDDVKTIPDFRNTKEVGEIKDAKRVADSPQLRAQRDYAAATGRQHTVITGTNTKVSKTVQEKSMVVRRDDLGPDK